MFNGVWQNLECPFVLSINSGKETLLNTKVMISPNSKNEANGPLAIITTAEEKNEWTFAYKCSTADFWNSTWQMLSSIDPLPKNHSPQYDQGAFFPKACGDLIGFHKHALFIFP